MFWRKTLMVVAATTAVAAGALMTPNAKAGVIGPSGSFDSVRDDGLQKVQFIIGGHRHCWYPDGWHGPGWYWCGYRTRVGLGWGGGEGWHGWRHEERREFRRDRREDRREFRRDRREDRREERRR